MTKAWQIGDQIEGRWEIFNIREGGAGVVYIVYDHLFQEPFAAKTFRDAIFARNPGIADRFMHESLAWINLDFHPNITQARMFERIDGKPFLFLEYVSGGDLSAWIGTPQLTQDLPRILRWAIEFCDGMIHARTKGIRVHRDIKPQNCLITRDGVLKVTDFGLVKLFEDDLADLRLNFGKMPNNLTATSVGTCTHMAPEQFEDARQVDLRADIYSFGVMLFQMVSGDLPFLGKDWNDLEQMHKTQSPPSLSNTDTHLAQVIHACMAKDPSSRFADFLHLRDQLCSIYQKLCGTSPPSPAQGAALNAIQWNNKGSSLDNLGLHREAISCFDSAIRQDGLFVPAWFNKGVALFESGQIQEALTCYQRVLDLNPNAENAWCNQGVALKSLGKTKESLACYERALQINRRYSNAWVNKGVLLKALGRNEEALACYERALVLNSKDEGAWTNKGNLLYALKRVMEALACYDRALELNPRLDRTWMNKGIAFNSLDRHEDALSCFSKAIQINPMLRQAWFLHGLTLMNAFARYRDALPYLEEAYRMGLKDADRALGLCKTALGAS
jgi:tetratricopeptide (TPR) repeat protein